MTTWLPHEASNLTYRQLSQLPILFPSPTSTTLRPCRVPESVKCIFSAFGEMKARGSLIKLAWIIGWVPLEKSY
jgi:hypothetical protein